MRLTPELVVALANHPRGLDRKGGCFVSTSAGICATSLPPRWTKVACRSRGFHLFRHTWATWMRRYGGLDTSGLLETGAWRDRSTAARYEHLDATEEAQKADLLPVPRNR